MTISEKSIRQIFIGSVLFKGCNAIFEIVGGALFLFTGAVTGIVEFLVKGELVEDPTDFIANAIQRYLPYLSQHAQLFAAFYFLSHGVIKLFLVIGLVRNKLWAYPAAIVVFCAFIAYQLYRFSHTHSIFLILLTIFDCAVIWLTWHEYKVVKNNQI